MDRPWLDLECMSIGLRVFASLATGVALISRRLVFCILLDTPSHNRLRLWDSQLVVEPVVRICHCCKHWTLALQCSEADWRKCMHYWQPTEQSQGTKRVSCLFFTPMIFLDVNGTRQELVNLCIYIVQVALALHHQG